MMAVGKSIARMLARWQASRSFREIRRQWFELKLWFVPGLNQVTYYHRVDDPYCLLMLKVVPRLLADFNVRLEIKLVLDLPTPMHPEPELEAQYGILDAVRLAQFHQIDFPATLQLPSREDAIKATGILLKHQHRPNLFHLLTEVTDALWGCSTTTFESAMKRYGAVSSNEVLDYSQHACNELESRGHYNSAMLYYGGEWFWGVDRLAHLVDRLNRAPFRRGGELADYQRQYRHITQGYSALRARPKLVKPLDFYFSFRSPYAYLAVQRVYKLADLYKIPVIAKPVLPLEERGILVSKMKRNYVLRDARREADKHHLPFGKLYDPLSKGVENAMALFYHAQQQGKEKEFITAALAGIWAEGLDLSRQAGLKKLVKQSALNWEDAQQALTNKDWQKAVERNQLELKSHGLWGVPAFKYGSLVLWGQDRLWALEQQVLSGTQNYN